MSYITYLRGDQRQGPRVEVGIAMGWDWEAVEMDADDLDDLISDLRHARSWLLKQDPTERIYGPPKPMDPLSVAILNAYASDIRVAFKTAATIHISEEIFNDNGQEAQ